MVDEKIAQLKAATREANEAIQGMREAQRDGKKLLEEIKVAAEKSVDEYMDPAVEKAIQGLNEATSEAMANATQQVFASFDEIKELLLGQNRANLRRGEPTVEEMVRARVLVAPHEHAPIARLPSGALSEECQYCHYFKSNKEVHPE